MDDTQCTDVDHHFPLGVTRVEYGGACSRPRQYMLRYPWEHYAQWHNSFADVHTGSEIVPSPTVARSNLNQGLNPSFAPAVRLRLHHDADILTKGIQKTIEPFHGEAVESSATQV